MVPSWLRSPLAIFALGVLAVALSILVLMAVDGDSDQAQLAGEPGPPDEGRTVEPSLVSPGRGALGHGAEAVVARGQGERKLVDQVVVVTGPLGGRHTLLWIGDDGAKTQTLVRPANVPGGSLHDPNSVAFYAVQRLTSGGARELGIVYDATAFGSGSPTARFALLRLEEGEWQLLWDSGADEEWRGSHGRVEFSQGDLSEIVVRSDSWVDGYDELSNVLHESNSGPHRYFVDTWVRNRDGYVRSSAETVPAPYATLVEFLYALGKGDDAGAQEWVTQAALVERARSFGMDGASQYWLITCWRGQECGKTEPIRFDPSQYHGEPAVAVFFEERDGQWLISDIQPDSGS